MKLSKVFLESFLNFWKFKKASKVKLASPFSSLALRKMRGTLLGSGEPCMRSL